MKILKVSKNVYGHYSVIFNKIPDLVYESQGLSYVGSVKSKKGEVILSNYLKYSAHSGAFAGRELSLRMEDGSREAIKDYWYDSGSYDKHGEFIAIGGSTIKRLQKCSVFYSMNINKSVFEEMLDIYLKKDKIYEYEELIEWARLQDTWYHVFIDGKKYPYMVNKRGDFVETESKNPICPSRNKLIFKYKKKTGKTFYLCIFKLNHKTQNGVEKIERNMLDVLEGSLPFSRKEIIKNYKGSSLREMYPSL